MENRSSKIAVFPQQNLRFELWTWTYSNDFVLNKNRVLMPNTVLGNELFVLPENDRAYKGVCRIQPPMDKTDWTQLLESSFYFLTHTDSNVRWKSKISHIHKTHVTFHEVRVVVWHISWHHPMTKFWGLKVLVILQYNKWNFPFTRSKVQLNFIHEKHDMWSSW